MFGNRCGCPNRRREELLDSCCRIPLLIHPCLPPGDPDPPIDICMDGVKVLGTRYYAMIHHPASSPFRQPMKIYIPPSGITEGMMQVLLPPSTRAGINGSYRVVYWEYRPLLNGNPRYRIQDKVIREEYWHVPYLSPGRGRHIDLIRSDAQSLEENMDVLDVGDAIRAFDVISISTAMNPHWDSALLYYSPFPRALSSYEEKAPPISHGGVGWGQMQPRPGAPYRLSYMDPYSWADVISG